MYSRPLYYYLFLACTAFSIKVGATSLPVDTADTAQLLAQAEIARERECAEAGFARLLGDEAFHRQATFWLFRLAMQQKDFVRAQFIAGLGRLYPADAETSPELLAACALRRDGKREQAMTQLKSLLTERGAYQGSDAERLDAQRAVYLAVIRLHAEHDQCFLRAWNAPEEARTYFPALSDDALQYMAR